MDNDSSCSKTAVIWCRFFFSILWSIYSFAWYSEMDTELAVMDTLWCSAQSLVSSPWLGFLLVNGSGSIPGLLHPEFPVRKTEGFVHFRYVGPIGTQLEDWAALCIVSSVFTPLARTARGSNIFPPGRQTVASDDQYGLPSSAFLINYSLSWNAFYRTFRWWHWAILGHMTTRCFMRKHPLCIIHHKIGWVPHTTKSYHTVFRNLKWKTKILKRLKINEMPVFLKA